MKQRVFTYIWEYSVKEEHKEQFMKFYGPDGNWVELFKKANGYISTTLNEDTTDSNRFTTIDIWRCKEDHDNFLLQFHDEYMALDKLCEKYTTHERLIGYFEQLGG